MMSQTLRMMYQINNLILKIEESNVLSFVCISMYHMKLIKRYISIDVSMSYMNNINVQIIRKHMHEGNFYV